MSKFLKKNAKLFTFIYMILAVLVVACSLAFMTQYSDVHIYFKNDKKQIDLMDPSKGYKTVIKMESDTEMKEGTSNNYLFKYFVNGNGVGSPLQDVISQITVADVDTSLSDYGYDGQLTGPTNKLGYYDDSFAGIIYNFQMDMNDYNDLLLTLGLFNICFVALFFVFANTNRKVYYITNLLCGIVSPLAIIGFTSYALVQDIGLMQRFGKNEALFKITAVLQDVNISAYDKSNIYYKDYSKLLDKASGVNNLTFIIVAIVLALNVLMSVFMIAYTAYRYKESGKRRAEIIERAVQKND